VRCVPRVLVGTYRQVIADSDRMAHTFVSGIGGRGLCWHYGLSVRPGPAHRDKVWMCGDVVLRLPR
jgi:hypothetical protein